MECFWYDDVSTNPAQPFRLPDEEARHARSLRLNVSDFVLLLNGKGFGKKAVITAVSPKEIWLEWVQGAAPVRLGLPPQRMGLALAVLKSRDAAEWVVEKAVELGCTDLYWMFTHRTERARINLERQYKLVREALKQTRRTDTLRLYAPVDWQETLARARESGFEQLAVATCGAQTPLAEALPTLQLPTLFCIGPEGDFTEAETQLALDYQAVLVGLGPRRLRAETAAVAVLSWHSLALQEPGMKPLV